eukprot:TRINITY_DN15460_c0_g1_i1.p1 TRINITY_DN15460_c0_g1~~TRINITY_DN15460_c0_g1_i1.p1  ORF type:complete len:251 (-),score=29.57 TRINITY_DN15460_c0_g1_i1:53-805(-)
MGRQEKEARDAEGPREMEVIAVLKDNDTHGPSFPVDCRDEMEGDEFKHEHEYEHKADMDEKDDPVNPFNNAVHMTHKTFARKTRNTACNNKTKTVVAVGCGLLLLVSGLYIMSLGVASVHNVMHLRDVGAVINATVTETRSGKELRYSFQVDGMNYTHSDETERTNLWSSLDHDYWKEVKRTGVVLVRYLPVDPSVNALVHPKHWALGDSVTGLLLGCVCALVGAAILGVCLFRWYKSTEMRASYAPAPS